MECNAWKKIEFEPNDRFSSLYLTAFLSTTSKALLSLLPSSNCLHFLFFHIIFVLLSLPKIIKISIHKVEEKTCVKRVAFFSKVRLFVFVYLFTWGFVNVKATKTAFVPTYTGREKTARLPSSSSSSSFANILNNSIMVLPK